MHSADQRSADTALSVDAKVHVFSAEFCYSRSWDGKEDCAAQGFGYGTLGLAAGACFWIGGRVGSVDEQNAVTDDVGVRSWSVAIGSC